VRHIVILAMVLLIVLITLGCGGGGNSVTPQTHDLASLVGTWDVAFTEDGTYMTVWGSQPLHDNGTCVWIIDKTHVLREGGTYYVWKYDGSILDLTYSWTDDWFDEFNDCGQIHETSQTHLSVPIKPGDVTASITGTADDCWISETYGEEHGLTQWTGNMSKR